MRAEMYINMWYKPFWSCIQNDGYHIPQGNSFKFQNSFKISTQSVYPTQTQDLPVQSILAMLSIKIKV